MVGARRRRAVIIPNARDDGIFYLLRRRARGPARGYFLKSSSFLANLPAVSDKIVNTPCVPVTIA